MSFVAMQAIPRPETTDSAANDDGGRIAPWKVVAIWTIPAILSTFETVMFASAAGRRMPVWLAFIGEAPQWYGWALLTPVIAVLADRYPLRSPVRVKSIAVHAGASLVASLFLAFCDALVGSWVRPSRASLGVSTSNWFLSGLPATTLVYFAIVIAMMAWRNSRRLRAREREAAQLEAQLREAQLGALRMQLQPHFLFNSLNAVMALVRDADTGRAIHALSLLSDVLRTTVNAGEAHETTLDAELDFVTRYLSIEQVRFGDRLHVTIDVPDGLRTARVPVFILQPFVENSLKHGVLRGREANEIQISARATNGTLMLTVRDDGVGLPENGSTPRGVGIENARRRLEGMYGSRGELTVSNARMAAGVEVGISVPLSS
jgi:two-component system LytT family sensor kinase